MSRLASAAQRPLSISLISFLLIGCAVQEESHFRIAPSPDNPREIKLGGMVTDQLLALYEQSGQDSEATLETLRAATESAPIVVIDDPLEIDKSANELWAEAIEPVEHWSFRAAARAVLLRPSDRALCIRLFGPVTNRRVAYWTWCSRDFLGEPVKHNDTIENELPRIGVATDRAELAFVDTNATFVPVGMDGAPPERFEPTADTDFTQLAEDYAEMKALGANFVRVHLQIGNFMDTATRPNPDALNALRRLIGVAEQNGLYVIITGLACYESDVIPIWYRRGWSDPIRWNTQAAFWAAIARTCAASNAVFAYDLMNAPVLTEGDDSNASPWLVGDPISFEGEDYFVDQRLVRTLRNRDPNSIRKAWIDKMAESIRSHDPNALLTVRTDDLPGFYSNGVDENLDFVGVHACQQASLEQFDLDKPLVVLPFALGDAPRITDSLVATIEGNPVYVAGCNWTAYTNLQVSLNGSPISISNLTETTATLDIPMGANSGPLVFESDQGSVTVDLEVYSYTSTEIGTQGHALSITVDSNSRVWVNMEFHRDFVKLEDGEVTTYRIPVSPTGVFASSFQGNDRETPASALGEDVVVGPNGNIWFTQGGWNLYSGQFGNHSRIVKFNPETEEFFAYNFPGTNNAIVGMTFAPDGTIWACQGSLGDPAIWHFDPDAVQPDNDFDYSTSLDASICTNLAAGCFRRYTLPPEHLHPSHLLLDNQGDVWYTNFWGNTIARLNPDTGDVNTYKLNNNRESPNVWVGSGPWEIYQEPSGDIVFNEFMVNTVNWFDYSRKDDDACLNHDGDGPNPGVHSVTVAAPELRVHSIKRGDDGRTWFTTFARRDDPVPTHVGFVTERGKVQLLPTHTAYDPGALTGPCGIAIDPNTGDIYVAEFWKNAIGKLSLR